MSTTSSGNSETPACEYPMPDACYSIPDNQQFGMCICKPCEISSGDYSISLPLLPAVQTMREAARRTVTRN